MAIPIIASLLTLLVAFVVSKVVYNVFFHPLRHFPGPVWWGATRLPWALSRTTGNLARRTHELHEQYGAVVRIAPDELVFIDAAAWQCIYGHRMGALAGVPEFPKAKRFYRSMTNVPLSIVTADGHEHALLRRALAHGFSEKALRDQEEIIQDYINLLIQRCREWSVPDPATGKPKSVDLVAAYNWCTFDIIGDLAFGDSFGCLRASQYHAWVKNIFDSIKYTTMFGTFAYFRLVWLNNLIVKWGRKSHAEVERFSQEKLTKRMEAGMERPDLIEGVLKKREEWVSLQIPSTYSLLLYLIQLTLNKNIDMPRLVQNSTVLVIAGSETTATLLSGLTYLLCTNPAALEKLKHEIRLAFVSDDDITFTSVNKLTYMLACINEAFRMYPPVPAGLPRVVPKGGAMIAGHWVPGGTDVSVPQWAAYHSAQNWTDPWEFHPERFLGDPKYENDKRDVLNPFSVGPRNCIGKNLAYAEMRVIFAKLIFNFDLTLDERDKNWINQKVFTLWDKPELRVVLTPAPARQI